MDKTNKAQQTLEEQAILRAKQVEEAISAQAEEGVSEIDIADGETPLDENVRLMSPFRMVLRRFFRSKLSIVGLVLIVGLIIFSWLGPSLCNAFGYNWGEIDTDRTGKYEYGYQEIEVYDENGEAYTFYQVVETYKEVNSLAEPSGSHLLGTDKTGKDVFVRLMYGGRISLSISFIAVFAVTILGVIFGGLAGYFGGWVDEVIMRICDILMCLPGMPLLLILGTILDAAEVAPEYRIYLLMTFLTIFSWSGTARLVRGQILYLREQEYMVAAEAMGFSTGRKIFKHLIPNIMPQLIVSMTLSLGSMILYEASLSYLGMGVRAPYAAWGTMINIVAEDVNILKNYFNIWGPPGICIVLAVLGFNFLGDGLRDALDPKMRR
jgi:peptide/nickel transport system permease protein